MKIEVEFIKNGNRPDIGFFEVGEKRSMDEDKARECIDARLAKEVIKTQPVKAAKEV